MNTNQAMQEIIKQCEETNGFLVKLRVNSIFDSVQYQSLIEALMIYEQAIAGDDVINRHVAGCIFYLVQVLESMTGFYAQNALENEFKVRNAHAEVWGLAEKVFSWPP